MTAIKMYRESAGMTQEKLAAEVGVGQSAIAMWESGMRTPDVFMIMKLAKIFGCTADDLLSDCSTESKEA